MIVYMLGERKYLKIISPSVSDIRSSIKDLNVEGKNVFVNSIL